MDVREFPDLNARGLFFRDPEGNVMEYVCHEPGSRDEPAQAEEVRRETTPEVNGLAELATPGMWDFY